MLLDSNIVIYAAHPDFPFLVNLMADKRANLSEISIPEVLGFPGIAPADQANFERWFLQIRMLPVDEVVLRRAARLRREYRMKLGDSIIAATALTFELDLVTRNAADFRKVSGIHVINPFD